MAAAFDIAKVRELAVRIGTACKAARHGVDADVVDLLQSASHALLGLLTLVEDLGRRVERLEAERDYLRRH